MAARRLKPQGSAVRCGLQGDGRNMPVREWPLLSLRPNLPNDRNWGA